MDNIIGIGTDIVEIKRIKDIFSRNKTFESRVFSKTEINFCRNKSNKFSCYAKRFAAKEAFVKAIGTGMSGGLNFNEIYIKNNKKGEPSLNLSAKADKIVKKLLKKKNYKIWVSLSDEKKYAFAMLIIATK